MALTHDQIDDLAEEGVFLGNIYEIAQAIEAEVRKQDDALILQLVEALEWTVAPPCMCWAGCEACHPANPPNPVAAISAGRARLEGKT